MAKLVATFAGDSGDGVQLLGNSFSEVIAQLFFDFNTLPDFPAEIRAPAGTIHGVSGFQIQWGDETIQTAGHLSDILVVFNAAGYAKYIANLKSSGLLIYDPAGFDSKNCKLANFDVDLLLKNPISKLGVEFSKLTQNSLSETAISSKEKDKNKNLFALGFLLFGIGGDLSLANRLLTAKFISNPSLLERMVLSLSQGYNYGDITEFSFHHTLKTQASNKEPGHYRNITGNKALAYALLAAPKIFNRTLFFGGYPITPASDILHELSQFNLKEIIVQQAEDEIAAATMALGAAYGGAIGVTASSGPGIDLKQEAIGLAHMAELPLLIVNIQRAGPSTGLPTKIEQSDLELALYGRHGDAPVPVLAISSPSKAFDTTIKAIEIMIRFQTPVFLLSDAAIANGSELWKIPEIEPIQIQEEGINRDSSRNKDFVKTWKIPGNKEQIYVAGGLERDQYSDKISYDGTNHENMSRIRSNKIVSIQKAIPNIHLEPNSISTGKLIISWGSTYGVVREACKQLNNIAHIHLEWINPLPENFNVIIAPFDVCIVVEMNRGQLANYLKTKTEKPIRSLTKTQGVPYFSDELIQDISAILAL